jgi:hypothetical protein
MTYPVGRRDDREAGRLVRVSRVTATTPQYQAAPRWPGHDTEPGAEPGAGDGVGSDAGRVIVGRTGDEARPQGRPDAARERSQSAKLGHGSVSPIVVAELVPPASSRSDGGHDYRPLPGLGCRLNTGAGWELPANPIVLFLGSKPMAKKSRGGRTTAAKKRATKSSRGKGRVKRRKAGRKILDT